MSSYIVFGYICNNMWENNNFHLWHKMQCEIKNNFTLNMRCMSLIIDYSYLMKDLWIFATASYTWSGPNIGTKCGDRSPRAIK